MVSKKMIEAVDDNAKLDGYRDGGNYPELLNPEQVAQAVVNAAWTVFDVKDETTWPDNGQWCFVMMDKKRKWFCLQFMNGHWWPEGSVTHWARPRDLSFKETE